MDCKDCKFNDEVRGIMAMAPGHVCGHPFVMHRMILSRIIMSPFGHPSWCPLEEENVES